MKSNKNIINGNCWVAYFDILGFSKMVENFPVWFVLEEYKKALEKSKRSNIKCKFKFFSDSFIFYTENDSQDAFSCIEGTSALFFQAMFLGRIPMRGCLNWEQFYADEENGIFFGPAQIEAYKLAEGQNWIGFVLSKKTMEKLTSFESVGIKSGYKNRYKEYKVPYNKDSKLRKLLAYNLNLLTTIGNTGQARNQQYQLWMALGDMEYKACLMLRKKKGNRIVNLKKCLEYKKITTIYKNTRKFMLCVYPALKEMTKNRVQAKV
jgi:hypothetical protein